MTISIDHFFKKKFWFFSPNKNFKTKKSGLLKKHQPHSLNWENKKATAIRQ